jgi:hypothetical protein
MNAAAIIEKIAKKQILNHYELSRNMGLNFQNGSVTSLKP